MRDSDIDVLSADGAQEAEPVMTSSTELVARLSGWMNRTAESLMAELDKEEAAAMTDPVARPEPIRTPLGRFKEVERDGVPDYLFECPGCGEWAELDDDQWRGRVSVDHSSPTCTYHETHDYLMALNDAQWRQPCQTR